MKQNINISIEDREIYLYDGIDRSSVLNVFKSIDSIVKSVEIVKKSIPETISYNPKPINLIINSEGGIVSDGFALRDYIKTSAIDINGIANGLCASIALDIFLSCKVRKAFETTMFVIHQPSGGVIGEAKDIKDCSEKIEKEKDLIFKHITENTNIPIEKLNEIYDKKKDWYINAEQALSLGIIHEIL